MPGARRKLQGPMRRPGRAAQRETRDPVSCDARRCVTASAGTTYLLSPRLILVTEPGPKFGVAMTHQLGSRPAPG